MSLSANKCTHAYVCVRVLCQRCAANLLPQRFHLTHASASARALTHSWHSPPCASRFCWRFYPSTGLLIGNIFTFCGVRPLRRFPASPHLPYRRSERSAVCSCDRKSTQRQRCHGTQGCPAPDSYGWEIKSWELASRPPKSPPVLNMPVLVIKHTSFFPLSVTAGIILLQQERCSHQIQLIIKMMLWHFMRHNKVITHLGVWKWTLSPRLRMCIPNL